MNDRNDFGASAETTEGVGGYSRPEEIERRIENTRQRMSEDISALSNKLRPRNLAAQAGEAITEKARDTGNGFVGLLRDNPLPALALGASLAWLVYSARRSDSGRENDFMGQNDYTGVERRVGGYQNMTGFRRRFDDFEGQSRIERVKQTASRITGEVSEKAHELSHRASEVADTAREKAGVVADRARERGERLKAGARTRVRQLDRETHEHPLKVAAGAAIAGLALGMLLPRTRKEDRVMGGARDELVDRAGETAARVKDVATEGARQVADTVKAEAAEHKPELKSMAEDLKNRVTDQVRETASRAKDEAKDAVTTRKGPAA
jgi:ElaB/YqjD/DUF883 family membrane-anchored ribosome-binding protein